MKYIDYLKDKVVAILSFVGTFIFMMIILLGFKVNFLLIGTFILVYLILYFGFFIYDYVKRNRFYKYINSKLNELDRKYLITELIKYDDFIDAIILKEYLYEIDKSFIEELNKYKYSNEEFKEYIELWCHEIKTPIATSKLIIDNNNNKVTNNILEEIDKVDSYVEQVLFYARSENVEKDYIISKVNLKTIMNDIILKNKKDILNKNIRIETVKADVFVYSDSKWIMYIINQIIINSIKYSKDKDSIIKISFEENKNNTIFYIEDNGIGIEESELERVFDKGFTGSNGRKKYNSTGIGLYLCKKLCTKLGHEINIDSVINEKTIVTITFSHNSMFEEVK